MEEKKRYDLINFLIKKYNLKSYCEIGTQSRAQNFDKIECAKKYCVDIDPKSNADFIGSSDDFFKQLNRNYDLYFIDASHIAEDVKRDFENCLRHSNNNTFIVLHDCNPLKEEHTIVPRPTERGHWQGSVYKFIIEELHLYYKKYKTVDIDCGCGVWNNSGEDILKDGNYPINNWDSFNANRKELLNLISWEKFVNA